MGIAVFCVTFLALGGRVAHWCGAVRCRCYARAREMVLTRDHRRKAEESCWEGGGLLAGRGREWCCFFPSPYFVRGDRVGESELGAENEREELERAGIPTAFAGGGA